MVSSTLKGNNTRLKMTAACFVYTEMQIYITPVCLHLYTYAQGPCFRAPLHWSVEMLLCNEAETLIRTLQERDLILSLPHAVSLTHAYLHTPSNLNPTQVERSRGRREGGGTCNEYWDIY